MLLPERLRLHGIGEQGSERAAKGTRGSRFFVLQYSCTDTVSVQYAFSVMVLVRELCRELGNATRDCAVLFEH